MKTPFPLSEVKKAYRVVAAGGVILYPTDTIWGIGCDATNVNAVSRILDIKRRPSGKALIVLVSANSMLQKYVSHIPEAVLPYLDQEKVPTTIIYPGKEGLAPQLYATDGSLAVRLIREPFCKHLIEMLGRPLVSTSANFSGDSPPAGFSSIHPGLVKMMDYVVRYRQNEPPTGKASKIIRVNNDNTLRIIRD